MLSIKSYYPLVLFSFFGLFFFYLIHFFLTFYFSIHRSNNDRNYRNNNNDDDDDRLRLAQLCAGQDDDNVDEVSMLGLFSSIIVLRAGLAFANSVYDGFGSSVLRLIVSFKIFWLFENNI